MEHSDAEHSDAEPSDAEPADAEPADFGAAVRELVCTIPSGRVMTYGDVAAALGSRASRQVGRVMAFEGADLPWWRVIRAGGHPPVDHEVRALEMYRVEGTPIVQGRTDWRVDLGRARWSPDADGRVADGASPASGPERSVLAGAAPSHSPFSTARGGSPATSPASYPV